MQEILKSRRGQILSIWDKSPAVVQEILRVADFESLGPVTQGCARKPLRPGTG